MSDYFGALMRSSGMAIAERMLPLTAPRDHISMPVKSDLQSATPISGAMTPPTREVPPPSLRHLEVPDTAPRIAQPMLIPPAEDAHGGQLVVPKPAATTGASGPSAPTVNETPAQAADVQSTWHSQALGHTLLRAAMQWVEVGPHRVYPTPDTDPTSARPGKRFPPGVAHEELQAQTSPTFDDEARSDTAHGIVQRPRPVPFEEAEPIEPVSRPTRPAVRHPDPNPLPVARDKPVEIVIGAIHLRVDAPAQQAVARTPAPVDTPGPRPTNGPSPARGSLGRRALRRI